MSEGSDLTGAGDTPRRPDGDRDGTAEQAAGPGAAGDGDRPVGRDRRNGQEGDLTHAEIERFWSKVEFGPDCWEWSAGRNYKGYGQFRAGGKGCKAHRVAWTIVRGPIPVGLVIDHLCLNRGCVNPDHMEVVTAAENTRRGRFWEVTAARGESTHCRNGHPYPENPKRELKDGSRVCRPCKAAVARRWIAARRRRAS